jgi:alkylation response protein AidB-like acyl-CoA dehydrogenase
MGVQIMGGYGLDAEYDMQRIYRDARSATIAAGT